TRRPAETITLRRQHPPVHRRRSATPGRNPHADARHGSKPRRHRNHPKHARKNAGNGKANVRIRQCSPARTLPRSQQRLARKTLAPRDCPHPHPPPPLRILSARIPFSVNSASPCVKSFPPL